MTKGVLMTLSKTLLLAGAATLVGSAALAGNIPMRASQYAVGHHVAPPVQSNYIRPSAGKCGTSFGQELSTPDGLIAWNDTSGTGYNTGGGADFTCTAKTKIKKVEVYGYDAPNNPEMYNVVIYKNDPAGGSDEANDNQVVCSYTGLSGAGGGSYPTHVLTKLTLSPACKIKKAGKYWIEVQNNDSAGPWYWEMSSTLQGTQADWVDRNNIFGSGCSTLDNNEYLSNCLGYTYPDYLFVLH